MAVETLHRPLTTPVLIGRDDLLALGGRRAESAIGGAGHLLFLAGEAGIGKTRLLGSIVREASRLGMRVLSAGAFARDVDLPGAVLLDLAHAMASGGAPAERGAGAAILARLAEAESGRGDSHRRRRLLVLEVADQIADLASAVPLTLALEDLHWADDLSMEVLGQLARRLPSLPILVVGTYRSDELYPRVPMREWRARLLTQRLAEEARLGRLTLEQTGAMAGHLLGGSLPAPSDLVEALQHRSDGIPLHVEEILGAMRLDPSAAGSVIPDTLTDAILRRRAALGREAARIADAAAVIDRSSDLELLAAVADRPIEVVGRAIAELEARYFIVPAATPGWYDLRHALIRDTLEAGISVARRRAIHERVARHVASRPELADDGFLSAHFEAAGLADEAFRHARTAARNAASLSAHREALELYHRAIRCAPPDLAAADRVTLLATCATEEAATDDNAGAAARYGEARRILLASGEPARAAALLPKLVAARHLLGDPLDERVAMLEAGFEELDTAPTGGDGPAVRGQLAAGLSAAHMLARHLDEAVEHGDRAIALAAEAGDEVTELNALTTLGSVLVFAGRMDDGWSRMEEAIHRARRARLESEAARAYRMIGSSASVLFEYPRAEQWLRDGIEYAERTEQWNHRHYMAAHLGHVLWATGDWESAVDVTQHALADGRGGITTRITALHVIGYLALGRAEWTAAEAALGEARAIGEEMSELQRLSPALWGLAEAAQLQGRDAEALELTTAGHRASAEVRDAAYLAPFLVTGTRARLALGDLVAAEQWVADLSAALRDRSIPGTLPAIDHAEGLVALARGATGRARVSLTTARTGWMERRRAWEGCAATIDLARALMRGNRRRDAAATASQAATAAECMGAAPLVARARELEGSLRSRGVTGEAWAPLTAREFEVASLIAVGRTNREIAAELAIAPKTVASHVEHILGRLGAERRTEIATWVASVQGG